MRSATFAPESFAFEGALRRKKGRRVLCARAAVKYAFVEVMLAAHSVSQLCRVLGVSRSGYYDWLCRQPSRREQDDQRLLAEIRAVHQSSRQSYGALKTWHVLQARGVTGGKHRIARLRRQNGIEARRKRRFRNAVKHEPGLPAADNLLQRRFHTRRHPNRVWVGDMTYVPIRAGWLYLAVLLDLHSRRIVGWAMDTRMTKALPLAALEMAVQHRQPDKGLLHHTDQGSQYTAHQYRQRLKQLGITASMSRKGNAWDNAVAESFFSNLKNELIHHRQFENLAQAKSEIFDYIEVFYNRQRAHASLEYMSPVEYEERAMVLNNGVR